MNPPNSTPEQRKAEEVRWAVRRIRLAIEAIRRRWSVGSEQRIAVLLRTAAEQVEGGEK